MPAVSPPVYKNGMVIGSGAGADLNVVTPLTDGQLYVGKTGYAPVPASITGTGITVTGGPGTIALSLPTLTDGQLIIGRTGLAPIAGAITGTGVTVALGAGTIALTVFLGAPLAFLSSGNTVAGGTTTQIGATLGVNATANMAAPFTGTAFNLGGRVSLSPGGVQTVAFTLQVENNPTALTTTITGAALGNQDTTHSVNFTIGDRLNVQVVYSATATTSTPNATVMLVRTA